MAASDSKRREAGAAGPTRSASKRLRLVVVTVLLSSVLAFLAAEAAVRIFFPYNTPDTVRRYSIQYVPAVYTSYRLKPVNRMVEVDSGKAWGTKKEEEAAERTFFINDRGYRGPPIALPKPAGRLRIIVLGGSAVFDQNVSDTSAQQSNSWPHLIEGQLKAKGYADVELINAGIPGNSTADSLGRLYTELWMYEPDIVLVYHGWNDIKFWSLREITPQTPLITKVRPYQDVQNPFLSYQGTWDRLFSHSQIYLKLRNRFYSWGLVVGQEGVVESKETKSSYSRHGPTQFKLNLQLIISACKAIGATPVLLTQGTLITRDNPEDERRRIAYDYQKLTHDALFDAFQETYQIIRDLAAGTDSVLIDVAEQLNGHGEFFSDHVHTTLTGSQKIAQIVGQGLSVYLRERPDTPRSVE